MRRTLIGMWLAGTLLGGAAGAAEGIWIQIEARPSQPQAEARARVWAPAFPELSGFRLPTGWFGLALGPHEAAEAQARLDALKRAGAIPADSYIVRGASYGPRFWPGGASASAAVPVAPVAPMEETPADARRSEAALPPEARAELQAALAWAGYSPGAADGTFGPATRAAMAAWQAGRGEDATGVLTAAQRAGLLDDWRAGLAALDLRAVTDGPAGIAITLPLGLVAFDRYAPPFALYPARDGSGMSLRLVSSPDPQDFARIAGEVAALLPGAEIRRGDSTLAAAPASEDGPQGAAHVAVTEGLVKGWVLVAPAGRTRETAQVTAALRESFRPLAARALDPTHAAQTEAERLALRAGTDLRRPRQTRSGLRVAPAQVLTLAEAVAGCAAVTADGRPAQVDRQDAETGLALLATAPGPADLPEMGLGPAAGEVRISGYSAGPAMTAPALSRGEIAMPASGDGAAALSAALMPGDSGGPVFDASGRVVAMVGPRADDGRPRALPAPLLARFLGRPEPAAAAGAPVARAQLLAAARAATVRVDCWD